MSEAPAALELIEVTKRFGRDVTALDAVSLAVPSGSLFGLIGESGSGKTTLARVVAGLLRPDSGEIRVAGERRGGAALHRRVQLVFQNPRGSLNPRQPVGRALATPLRHIRGLDAGARSRRIAELLQSVQLDAGFANRYPHELSGGEAQRVALARALAAAPEIVLLDEPTSALDVLIQREILRLLGKLRRENGLTLILISHDLAVIDETCEAVAVLERGRIVERGPTRQVLGAPRHDYTRALLRAAPRLPDDIAAP